MLMLLSWVSTLNNQVPLSKLGALPDLINRNLLFNKIPHVIHTFKFKELCPSPYLTRVG